MLEWEAIHKRAHGIVGVGHLAAILYPEKGYPTNSLHTKIKEDPPPLAVNGFRERIPRIEQHEDTNYLRILTITAPRVS
jgi:hypothetical protein